MYQHLVFLQMDLRNLTEFHEKGYIDRVITTNLTYLPSAFYEREYFTVADMSKFIAADHRFHDHDVSYQF